MRLFGRKKRNKGNDNDKNSGGGLLGAGARGAAAGSTFAGIQALGSLFGGSDGDPAAAGAGGGFGTSRGMGAGGSGSSNYTPSAAATSVLSDADSSDPVVRQLQDIEKVLVSIKGDTSLLAAGTGGGIGRGKNNPALQGMYGQPKRSDSDLKSFLPLLLAGMFGFFNQNKGGDGPVDKNYDGVDDSLQNPIEVATEQVADPKVVRQATNAPRAIIAAGEVTGQVARGVVSAGKGVVSTTGTVLDAVRGASTAAEATSTLGDAVKSNNIIDMSGKPVDINTIPEAVDAPAPDKASIPDVPTPDVDSDSIKAKVGRGIGKFIGKTLPGAGDLIAGAMMFNKLGEGDFEGAFYEGASIASSALGAAGAVAATGTGAGAVAAPAIALAGSAGSTYFDYKSITRDLYKEIFGHFPKDDPNYTPEREQEVLDAVVEYIKNLPADMMGPSEPELQVEARPEVTARSGHMKRNQQNSQRNWDKKYGEMYNPDGSMKPELVPAAKAEFESQGAGFPARIQNRIDPLIEDAKALGEEFKEGAERLAPGLKISSDTVEVTTESATRVDQEKQASMMGATVGESVATNQKVQGTGVLANQPSVNVSVAGTKTTFPTDSAAMLSIMRNGSYAV
jgi:hypothetical protein